MDTYRGNFVDRDTGDEAPEYGFDGEESVRETPPSPVGQDERRMQVRAYNHWASLLGNRNFPSVEDLDPDNLPDFGPYSVLLDFTNGIENPAVQFLGETLARECGVGEEIESLADVPSRSLLSRITDHYMQILANQAPIGFEAEFVNQRACTILYRGILLPFSSDDDTIDFIYGVINWKELADQQGTDALLREVDAALELETPSEPRRDAMVADWADAPVEPVPADSGDSEVLDLGSFDESEEADSAQPESDFSHGDLAGKARASDVAAPSFASLSGMPRMPGLVSTKTPALPPSRPLFSQEAYARLSGMDEADGEADQAPFDYDGSFANADEAVDPDSMELADWLASARELAEAAHGSEDRTRQALYAAIGRAYDFSLAAAEAPDDFAELVADAGLVVQDRAPLLPVVKLVFGADYDKTRLTEYATALGHAHRIGLPRGDLAGYLGRANGGLKGVIGEERRLRNGETPPPAPRTEMRKALVRKLRKLETFPLDAVPADGSEFTLLVARRLPSGEVVLLGEVADDIQLLEKAAKKLL